MVSTEHSTAIGQISEAQAEATEYETVHATGYRFYFMTWIYLALLTAFEITLVLSPTPRALLVTGLLIFTFLKAALIILNFMHVRYEKIQFLYVVVAPFIFVAILFFGVAPDFASLP